MRHGPRCTAPAARRAAAYRRYRLPNGRDCPPLLTHATTAMIEARPSEDGVEVTHGACKTRPPQPAVASLAQPKNDRAPRTRYLGAYSAAFFACHHRRPCARRARQRVVCLSLCRRSDATAMYERDRPPPDLPHGRLCDGPAIDCAALTNAAAAARHLAMFAAPSVQPDYPSIRIA